MKKFLIALLILAATTTTVSFSHKAHAQGNDLCRGTNGNGEIVHVGSDSFTLLHNDGRNLIVSLTSHATIEASTGLVSLSDLKIGNRVTLVGDDNRDGTFTADAVVVCSNAPGISTQGDGANQTAAITARNKNSEAYEKVSGIVDTATMLLVGLVWVGMIAFLLFKRKKSLVYVLFFTIFYIYLYKVLDIALFQFQSLLLIQHFVPELILNGFREGTNVNLVPLATLTLEDLKTSLLNILMLVPFGFGLPFITNFRFKRVVIVGFLFSVAIELLQLITGFMANTTFRVADVNDLIFNTFGVAIGYILFVQFILVFRRIFSKRTTLTNPVLRYISRRPQLEEVEN